jgi:hypothetical protein
VRKLIGICLVVLCSACAKRPVLAPSDIEYLSMTDVPGYGQFEVRFSSDTDLMRMFQSNLGKDQASDGFTCYLDARINLSERHGESNYLIGTVEELDRPGSRGKYQYFTRLIAVYTDHEYGSNTFPNAQELLVLLKARNALACRFHASDYFYGPYESNPIGIPSSEFVRVIEQRGNR